MPKLQTHNVHTGVSGGSTAPRTIISFLPTFNASLAHRAPEVIRRMKTQPQLPIFMGKLGLRVLRKHHDIFGDDSLRDNTMYMLVGFAHDQNFIMLPTGRFH